MKRILFLIVSFTTLAISQTNYYKFTELRGMEDSSGNTHLFYRSFTQGHSNIAGSYYYNSIYRLEK